VDELVSREVGHLRKMEPTGVGIPHQAEGSYKFLSLLEEEYGINNVMQDKPEMSDEQWAVLAANNSGLDFLSLPTKVTGGEVIKILDGNEEDVLNKYE